MTAIQVVANVFQVKTTGFLEPIMIVPEAVATTEPPESLVKVFRFGFGHINNPPAELFAFRVPLEATRGDGMKIVTGPETRYEPTMIGTSASPILAWSDARKYAIDITQGEVELYASILGPDLVSTTHLGFSHSHFIEGTADIRGIAAGENAILTWIDERHGGSVLDPKPEVYLETIWQ